MTAYVYTAPSGFAGDVSRPDESNVESAKLISPYPSNFGVAMKNATGGVTPMTTSDVASSFAGILVRSVPGISQSNTAEQVNTFEPNQNEVNGLLVRGYGFVPIASGTGTPVRGAPVYFCNAAGTGHTVGTFEATSASSYNVALSGTIVGNVTFASDGIDANGMAEIRIAQ